MNWLAGRAALVTYASRNIGRAIAIALAARGAADRAAGEETVAAVRAAGGSALVLRGDLQSRHRPQHRGESRRRPRLHTLRVVIIVTAVPFLFGFDPGAPGPAAAAGATYAALAAAVGLGAGLAVLGSRIGMLNPWVVMPMVASAGIVAAGYPLQAMPGPLLTAAQVFIGFSLGARLRARAFARVPRAAIAGLASGLALGGATVFAAVPPFVHLTGVAAPTMARALAPGCIGEMIASAKALGAAAALVAGFQFTRSFLTNLIAPSLTLRLVPPGAPPGPPARKSPP